MARNPITLADYHSKVWKRSCYWLSLTGKSGFRFDVSPIGNGEIYFWRVNGSPEESMKICERIDAMLMEKRDAE